MIKVLVDADITGFQFLLVGTLEDTGWSKYQLVEFVTLSDVGLEEATSDREIWRRCQLDSMLLLTANRNRDDTNSLEQTINDENSDNSLPVITVSNQDRLHNASYREACIESLINIVLELSNHLGTGRLYIP